jgi:hypothetical protein
VCAALPYGQKTTIFQAVKVKSSGFDVIHAAGRKLVYFAGADYAAKAAGRNRLDKLKHRGQHPTT